MSAALDAAHRRELRTLTGLAERDLAALWREVTDAELARNSLTDILARLVAIYGTAAATLAADYFDESREAAGARGRFRAIPATPVADEALEVLARVAAGPLFQAKPDFLSALTLARGGLQRHVANVDRETVRRSSLDDPKARGWMRVGDGATCTWCKRYLDGVVRHVEGYDFNAHDHCGCIAVPVFG